ncbi:MAG: hypothetical protein ABS939_02665 [Psychrobacillus sp.]
MKKFIGLASLLLLFGCNDNQSTETLTYSHSVDEGAIYLDNNQNTVFIDANTLSELVASPNDPLQVTYSNGHEIESVQKVNK